MSTIGDGELWIICTFAVCTNTGSAAGSSTLYPLGVVNTSVKAGSVSTGAKNPDANTIPAPPP